MKKTLALIAALLMLLAAGCAAKPQAGITDFLGEPVTLEKFPERIVSLTPSNTEIVCALGLGGKLVGVDVISDYPEEVQAIEKVGDFNGPNLEAIVGLKPDLVLGGNKLQKDMIEQIRALDLNTVAVEATTYEDVYKSIEIVGQLTGTERKAKELVAEMQAKEKTVLDAVAKAGSGKLVYYAMSFGEFGNWTGGPGSFPYAFIEKCGGRNMTEGFEVSWVNLNMEELIAKDPDIILLASDAGDPEAFKAAEGYKELKAVKNGAVYVVDANLCSRPGPRMADGLRAFAEAITGTAISFEGEQPD